MKTLYRFARAGLLLLYVSTGLIAQSITSFSPASAAAGSTVTITGTGFSLTIANNVVYFGAGRGTVTAASSEVAVLLDEDRKAGVYNQVVFDASRIASGVYFATLEFRDNRMIKKMLVLK